MVIKLYLDYSSQPSRAVLAFLIINKIPHDLIQIRISKGQTRSQQFIKINPMKKVPVIVDTDSDNFALAQSHAILRYLSRKFNTDQKWYPKNDLKRTAKIDQYLDFHHTSTRRCSYLIFNTLFAKAFNMVDPTFNGQRVLKQVQIHLRNLDAKLANSGYIVGQSPSIADLSAFFQIQFLMLLNYPFQKWKNLSRWMKYMKGIKEVQEANKRFYLFADKLKQLNPQKPKL